MLCIVVIMICLQCIQRQRVINGYNALALAHACSLASSLLSNEMAASHHGQTHVHAWDQNRSGSVCDIPGCQCSQQRDAVHPMVPTLELLQDVHQRVPFFLCASALLVHEVSSTTLKYYGGGESHGSPVRLPWPRL